MNIYIVERKGVYGAGIGGAYSSEEKAIEAAKEFIAQEDDDYHTFDIYKIELDKLGKFGYPDTIEEIVKKGEEIKLYLNKP